MEVQRFSLSMKSQELSDMESRYKPHQLVTMKELRRKKRIEDTLFRYQNENRMTDEEKSEEKRRRWFLIYNLMESRRGI